MKWLLLILCLTLICSLSGCFASVKYNHETKEITYTRFGNQEFNDFRIVLPDGSYLEFEHQKSEAKILAEIIAELVK